MVPRLNHLIKWPYNVILNPSNIVNQSSVYVGGSPIQNLNYASSSISIFIINIFLYTFPLSVGSDSGPEILTPPNWLETLLRQNGRFWGITPDFIILLIENALLLFYASILTFLIFHISVWIMRGSRGWVYSLDVITVSTGIYLAIVFNLLVIGASEFETTGELLLSIQAELINTIIMLTGSTLPLRESSVVDPTNLSDIGQIIILGLCVSILYYLYALFLGSKRVHNLSWIGSIVVIGSISFAPIIYLVFALVTIEFTTLPPEIFGL
jgi:hypothetical protein